MPKVAKYIKRLVLIVTLVSVPVGCGSDSDFSGRTTEKPLQSTRQNKINRENSNVPTTPVSLPRIVNSPYHSVTWEWHCDNVDELSATKTNNLYLPGAGHFTAEASKLSQVPLTIRGTVCSAHKVPRDIVFIVDTSGSMAENDPSDGIFNKTCGRFQAIENAVAKLSGEDVLFGVGTFTEQKETSSRGLFRDKESLFTDLDDQEYFADAAGIICSSSGDTSFDVALETAEQILSFGRPNATKEIFFISDGKPEPEQEDGQHLARRLKSQGISIDNIHTPVSIATIFIKNDFTPGDDDWLKKLASRAQGNRQDKLLHFPLTEVDELIDTLTQLAINPVNRINVNIRYANQHSFTSYDVTDYIDNYGNFLLPAGTVDSQLDDSGLEVVIEYWDSWGKVDIREGFLSWQN